ncbi:hypothetical protein GT045_14390 [Streptomyces sp. SID486]|uniref:hypothetical protein n=1 Tax=Streptomyces sp. SID486 TaxID=2690264 RepID=UPI001369F1CF|nr:hypothetical protein [Streptomyces sp. SID486]MYW18902.1 hypothetical protein [Streptomyces sp. SID2955]MYX95971.1 hypothetical protein [Streptomyces sp. SID486]
MRGSMVGTAVTLAAGALLTATMTTATASPPTPAATPHRTGSSQPVLVDCLWHRTVRPDDFLLACGDGNSRLTGLHWDKWSPGGATAVGLNLVNDCKPYCAAGTFHAYPVSIRLDGSKTWKKHPEFQRYTRLSLTYPGVRPEGYRQVMTYPLWD